MGPQMCVGSEEAFRGPKSPLRPCSSGPVAARAGRSAFKKAFFVFLSGYALSTDVFSCTFVILTPGTQRP